MQDSGKSLGFFGRNQIGIFLGAVVVASLGAESAFDAGLQHGQHRARGIFMQGLLYAGMVLVLRHFQPSVRFGGRVFGCIDFMFGTH